MLIRADNDSFERIKSFCNSPLGTRISCYAQCYGFGRDFVEFWVSVNDKDIDAVIMRFYDSITITAKNCKSIDDLIVLTDMLACSEVVADVDLSFNTYVLNAKKTAYVFVGNTAEFSCDDVPEESIKSMYRLICESIPGSFSDDEDSYLSFLSDFIFRKMRFAARAKGVFQDNELISCALTSAETENSALLSGVACIKTKRQQGAGKRVVLSLANELQSENKKVYVIALNESAKGFYEHIGFKEFEKIYYFGRKN